MNDVYIGDTYSISSIGFGINDIFTNLLKGISPLLHPESILDRSKQNDIPGKISSQHLDKFKFKNKVISNGPIEARYSYYAVSELFKVDNLWESFKGKDCGLFVGTMNNLYGAIGLRNGYRVCADENLQYDSKYFEKMIGTGFSYVHPMIPVYKIPNNVIANIALDYQLSGSNANFFGEDSSAVAIQESYSQIKYGLLDKTLVSSSNFLFLNFLDFLLKEAYASFIQEPKFNPEIDPHYFMSEWGFAGVFATKEFFDSKNLKIQAKLLSSHQGSYVDKYYTRSAPKEYCQKIIDKALSMSNINIGDLDLIITDNLDKNKTPVLVLKDLMKKQGASIPILTPSLLTGHSLCTNASSQLEIALKIFKEQKVFSSYLEPSCDLEMFTNENKSLNVKRIAIFNQSLNNTLQMQIIEKYED
ncbi:MAG: hypothetical protein KC646_04140 [Candidatus Cloacimonetes bacterium]|nr:hypothetical protein [Candidatus Cloacimonadota bacterium]